MKNFLRKLHIGDSAGDGASSPAPPPSSRKGGGAGAHHEPAKHASGISSWLSSVAGRPPPLPAAAAAALEAEELALASSLEERRAEDEEAALRDSRNEGRKREIEKQEVELEEYHMQLALEMSAREDPEAVQIEVAKQISLGSCPLQSPAAEVLAFRYWSASGAGVQLEVGQSKDNDRTQPASRSYAARKQTMDALEFLQCGCRNRVMYAVRDCAGLAG
ncbi:hypothetical protein ACQ4PT_023355 [Festuca glaucescens]